MIRHDAHHGGGIGALQDLYRAITEARREGSGG
jgi:hypothetical protein